MCNKCNKRSGTWLSEVFWGFHPSFPLILKHLNRALGLRTNLDILAVAAGLVTGPKVHFLPLGDFFFSRKENCFVKSESANKIDQKWKKIQRYFGENDEKEFAIALESDYHTTGHLIIAEDCKPEGEDLESAMSFEATSARDPTFYR